MHDRSLFLPLPSGSIEGRMPEQAPRMDLCVSRKESAGKGRIENGKPKLYGPALRSRMALASTIMIVLQHKAAP